MRYNELTMSKSTATAYDQEFIVTVDVALFCLKDSGLHVVVHRRDKEPFQGKLALPGGYVHKQEDADSLAAAIRVIKQKTGISPPYLEQLYTFADAKRDPRGWSVSMSYFALVSEKVLMQSREATGATERFELMDVDSGQRLSFDHNRILNAALERLRNKSAYSTLPCFLLERDFTLGELQATYESVMGVSLNKSAFRRKMAELDILEESSGQREGAHRPAQLFRLKKFVSKRLTVLDRPI